MYLTAKQLGAPRDSHDHEELELLMESFDKQVEEIVSEIENLSANVSATEAIVELILDSNRNELLALDLKVSIGTLGLTSGALVAGLFGMVGRSPLLPLRSQLIKVDFTECSSSIPLLRLSTNRVVPQLATQIETSSYAFGLITFTAFSLASIITIVGLRRLRQMRRVGLSERGGTRGSLAGWRRERERIGQGKLK